MEKTIHFIMFIFLPRISQWIRGFTGSSIPLQVEPKEDVFSISMSFCQAAANKNPAPVDLSSESHEKPQFFAEKCGVVFSKNAKKPSPILTSLSLGVTTWEAWKKFGISNPPSPKGLERGFDFLGHQIIPAQVLRCKMGLSDLGQKCWHPDSSWQS